MMLAPVTGFGWPGPFLTPGAELPAQLEHSRLSLSPKSERGGRCR